MKELLLYHGSDKIIKEPYIEKSKSYADFGFGFYCTKYAEIAKEWACTYGRDGCLNKYEFNTDGLKVLDLTSKKYTLLHWLAIVADNRKYKIASPLMRTAILGLRKNFHLNDLDKYDVIIGYRADDSNFTMIRSFLNNEISLNQLMESIDRSKYSKQYVLKSQKAMDRLEYIGFEPVKSVEYFQKRLKRDEKALEKYQTICETKEKGGLFIREFILREVYADDPRLQR